MLKQMHNMIITVAQDCTMSICTLDSTEWCSNNTYYQDFVYLV